ncbi:MAG TPA: hypothetical protein PKB14_25460 [Rubrivivax sp.]|nr:hypothetical protein [Rubrivivax sp.]
MTPAERAEQHQVHVEQRLFQYPGAAGFVRRWFVPGNPHPFHTEAEALQVAARQHERRGQP